MAVQADTRESQPRPDAVPLRRSCRYLHRIRHDLSEYAGRYDKRHGESSCPWKTSGQTSVDFNPEPVRITSIDSLPGMDALFTAGITTADVGSALKPNRHSSRNP